MNIGPINVYDTLKVKEHYSFNLHSSLYFSLILISNLIYFSYRLGDTKKYESEN